MVGNKQVDAGGGNSGGGASRGPDTLSGRRDIADAGDSAGGDTGQNQQRADAGSNSAHYTGGAGAGTERESGIVASSPESNVGPAGAPQSSRGSAGGPVPGGTEGRNSGENSPTSMGAAAAGGNPGTSAASGQDAQGATDAAVGSGSTIRDLTEEAPDKPGGGDTR